MSDVRRLLLLRHGRTSWNHEGRAQGLHDVGLDAVGHAQAAEAGRWLAPLDPVGIWTSDLVRARHTAAHLGEACGGLVPRIDPRLREFDVGARTGLTMTEYADANPDEHAAFESSGHDAVAGAESTTAVAERMRAGLGDVVSSLGPGRTAVVVGHGASLKLGLMALLAWPRQLATSLRGLDNCHWVDLWIDVDGSARLVAYNRPPTGEDALPEGRPPPPPPPPLSLASGRHRG